MLGVTLFGIVLTPVFYSVIQWLVDLRGPGTPPPAPALADGHAPQPTPPTGFSATPVGHAGGS
jgi:hypothetical protein